MSEFREDPVSGDWVLIAPGRASRPSFLTAKRRIRKATPKSTCPFEHPEETGNWPPLLAYPDEKHWNVMVVPNKYPALIHQDVCSVPFHYGMYLARTGVGDHDLVITRDHRKNFADLAPAAAREVFKVFQARCFAALKNPCTTYVIPFFNWGPNAGASVGHPHYQIVAAPIIPGHSAHSMANAAAYYKRHGRCVRCDVITMERKERVRIVAENRHAIALAPYASKIPFEVSIMTKAHHPFFYKTPDAVTGDVAALLQLTMKRLKAHANDPDLNFFIHEAPVDEREHRYHHWHVEVLPRLTVPAGFEFSTGIYINIVPPELATAILAGKKKAQTHYY